MDDEYNTWGPSAVPGIFVVGMPAKRMRNVDTGFEIDVNEFVKVGLELYREGLIPDKFSTVTQESLYLVEQYLNSLPRDLFLFFRDYPEQPTQEV